MQLTLDVHNTSSALYQLNDVQQYSTVSVQVETQSNLSSVFFEKMIFFLNSFM